MTDRELLELAAKAAGMHFSQFQECWYEGDEMRSPTWNPLEDDGDALRLAVKLRLTISPYPVYEQPKHSVIVDVKAHAECPNATPPLRYCSQCTEPCQLKKQIAETSSYGDDPCTATRRAIVRAAAEVGKETK